MGTNSYGLTASLLALALAVPFYCLLGVSACVEATTKENTMGWATTHIDRLQRGETFEFNAPAGNSMRGKINPGDRIRAVPVGDTTLEPGMIVLCKVRGSQYLHLVRKVNGDRVLIGNNHGFDNGWTPKTKVYGICTNIERSNE